jgi:hypothetical protein
MPLHPQTWVKVNTTVDVDVADIIATLNTVEGLETLQSCQGDVGREDGYVYFANGDWRRLGEFVFEKIGPRLKERVDEDASLKVDATTGDMPIAKLSFKAEATKLVASTLRDVLL